MAAGVAELSPSAAARRDAGRRQGTVFFAWVHGADVRADFMSSVVGLFTSEHAGLLGKFLDLPSGPFLSAARNTAAAQFLSSGLDWLWFCDSDVVFTPQDLAGLLDLADPVTAPVVSGVLPVTPEFWCAYTEDDSGLAAWPAGRPLARPLQQVAGTGCGFIVIHRTAVQAAGQLPFAEESAAGVCYGEDISFCRRLGRAGIPVHVAAGVRVGHAKVVTL